MIYAKPKKKKLIITGQLSLSDLLQFVFQRDQIENIEVSPEVFVRIDQSENILKKMIANKVPIYGVTTGFGDSCHKVVQPESAAKLQENLILYLSCGTGEILPLFAVRAMTLIRLNSMARGYSGISRELMMRMLLFLEKDLLPQVPCEGSLGASGDLIPLAYYAQLLQGRGHCFYQKQCVATETVLQKLDIPKYDFKPKEALAIVNGTSTMAGMLTLNLKLADWVYQSMVLATSWQCMVLGGRIEAFGVFINEIAKTNPGQSRVAKEIRSLLKDEDYTALAAQNVKVVGHFTESMVQDRYSLRCVPQILGPIREQLDLAWNNLQHEINSITDNPLFSEDGHLELGGNFYGGYLCQSHDILKMNMAHIADLLDRQLAMLIDEKSNRGLPANLIDTQSMPEEFRHCHQGLKGVHQAVSAITSEILQRSIPNGIFSRSSESHNQDKVSMGMGAAMSAYHQMQAVIRIMTMHLISLAQAIDLSGIKLKGAQSLETYNVIRSFIPMIKEDTELGPQIQKLALRFTDRALNQ